MDQSLPGPGDAVLLENGTWLLHDEDDHVIPTKANLLIKDSKIAKIGHNLPLHAGTEIIDCTDKYISPGFIDTHRHVWQTALKGRHADQTLLEYFPDGNFVSSLYEPEDVCWGQLSGCLESLDAGTTTVVDHAHINITAEHTYQALSATVSSGIRSVFGYCPTGKVKKWSPFEPDWSNTAVPWVLETFDTLAAESPLGDGRVKLAFALDALNLPREAVRGIYAHVRGKSAHLITSHSVGGLMFNNPPSALKLLNDHGLLASDILISHATNLDHKDSELLASTNASISSTPSTELQMGMGLPSCFEPAIYPHSGIGIDCHSNQSSFIPGQMTLAVQAARHARTKQLNAEGKWERSISPHHTVERAFNLGTIGGAKAAGLSKEIGRLQEGCKADILVWDALSPNLLAAAQHDPVAAIVLHSGPGDIESVFVDGKLRKDGGKLVDVKGAAGGHEQKRFLQEGKSISWGEVAREVLRSRDRLQEKVKSVDRKAAQNKIIGTFQMHEASMVEN